LLPHLLFLRYLLLSFLLIHTSIFTAMPRMRLYSHPDPAQVIVEL
jgi:hypothetical protein